MNTPTRDIPALITRLREASLPTRAGRVVGMARVAQILGTNRTTLVKFAERQGVEAKRVAVKPCRRVPRGYVAAWLLTDAIAAADIIRPRSTRRWSDADRDFIQDHFTTLSRAQLASHFGVTPLAMDHVIRRMGLNLNSASGLMTTVALARLLGIHYNTPKVWCNSGLKHQRAADHRRSRLIDPGDVWNWLAKHDRQRNAIPAEGLARLQECVAHQCPKARAA